MTDEAGHRPAPARLVWAVALGLAAIVLVLDQATKALAVAVLSERTIDLGVMDLRLVRNLNAAFSLPVGIFPGFYLVVTAVVAVVVLRALPQTDRLSVAAAFGMVLGGSLGNAVDRATRAPGFPDGAVVDFFDLRWFPVFNIADSAIVCGAALLALLLTLIDREQRAASSLAAADDGRRRGAGPGGAGPDGAGSGDAGSGGAGSGAGAVGGRGRS